MLSSQTEVLASVVLALHASMSTIYRRQATWCHIINLIINFFLTHHFLHFEFQAVEGGCRWLPLSQALPTNVWCLIERGWRIHADRICQRGGFHQDDLGHCRQGQGSQGQGGQLMFYACITQGVIGWSWYINHALRRSCPMTVLASPSEVPRKLLMGWAIECWLFCIRFTCCCVVLCWALTLRSRCRKLCLSGEENSFQDK